MESQTSHIQMALWAVTKCCKPVLEVKELQYTLGQLSRPYAAIGNWVVLVMSFGGMKDKRRETFVS